MSYFNEFEYRLLFFPTPTRFPLGTQRILLSVEYYIQVYFLSSCRYGTKQDIIIPIKKLFLCGGVLQNNISLQC